MLALVTGAMAAGVTVTIPVEAKVKGTEIELGEVAQVSGLDPELVERVRAFELGYAPAPGFSRLLTSDGIRAELAKQIPGVDVRVAGERACRVWPELEELSPARLEEAARAEFARAYSGKEATFTLKDPIPAVKIPMGSKPPTIVAHAPTGELFSGVLGMSIEIQVDG